MVDLRGASAVGQSTAPVAAAAAPWSPARAGLRLRADHVADLLTVLLVLYTVHVLTPVLVAPDFINLELTSELAETSESNFVNQLFWLGATVLGVIAIVPVWRPCLNALMGGSSCLAALAGLALLSSIWAVEPGISLRRAVLQAMVIFCVMAAVGGQPLDPAVLDDALSGDGHCHGRAPQCGGPARDIRLAG